MELNTVFWRGSWMILSVITMSLSGSMVNQGVDDGALAADGASMMQVAVGGSGYEILPPWSIPGSAFTVTLQSASGEVRSQDVWYELERPERIRARFGLKAGDAVRAGDRIVVESVVDDPYVGTVPDLRVQADEARETVYGIAEPFSQLEIVADRRDEAGRAVELFRMQTTADANGEFSVVAPVGVDLISGDGGAVSYVAQSGFEFHAAWNLLSTKIDMTTGRISGTCPWRRAIRITLVGNSGAVMGSHLTYCSDAGFDPLGLWSWSARDAVGTAMSAREVAKIDIDLGDRLYVVQMPTIEGYVDLGISNAIGNVRGAIRADILVKKTNKREVAVPVSVGSGGSFLQNLSLDGEPIRYGDRVALRAFIAVGTVSREIGPPALEIDLDSGNINGWIPSRSCVVRLSRAGAMIAEVECAPAVDGQFTARLQDGDGVVVVPAAGDLVALTLEGGEGYEPVVVEVPVLEVITDVVTKSVSGRATAGGSLVVTAHLPPFVSLGSGGQGGHGSSIPEIESDGTFRAVFEPPLSFAPGQRITAKYTTASQLVFRRSVSLPFMNLEYGGVRVCGFARPQSSVLGRVLDEAGGEIGSFHAQANSRGEFVGEMMSSGGDPIVFRSGQNVVVDGGGPVEIIEVPRLEAQVNWQEMKLSVFTLPSSKVTLYQPALNCGTGIFDSVATARQIVTADQSGVARAVPNVNRGANGAMQVSVLTESGHRIFRTVIRPQIWVQLESERVGGIASPFEVVNIEADMQQAAGIVRATTKADASGQFGSRLLDGMGGAVNIVAGDVMGFATDGDRLNVTVPVFWFDASVQRGIQGKAPPLVDVRIELNRERGDTNVFVLPGATDGSFRFDPRDIPPWAGWAMSDVTTITASIQDDEGNEYRVVTQLNQSGETSEVFVPFAFKAWR